MRQFFTIMIICSTFLFGCKSQNEEKEELLQEEPVAAIEVTEEIGGDFEVSPVSHATMVLNWDGSTIYVDPVGGAQAFSEFEEPDMVFITDIHQDHLDPETLNGLDLSKAEIIVPQAVKEQLSDSLSPQLIVMDNGETITQNGFTIKAIPMYNLREEAKQFHPKGRGNGYVIEKEGKRVYIAGDTEDIPEMRNLKNIDVAFVPMNLPYTMPVDAAADAVIDFAPDKVYPYHFRGQDGKADVEKFRSLVNEANQDIKVVLANWYPNDSE